MGDNRVVLKRSQLPVAFKSADIDVALMAVSPIDGRYRARTRSLAEYFSEFALIRYRVKVEVEWYLTLAQDSRFEALMPPPSPTQKKLRAIYESFSLGDARRVKE